MTVLFPCAEGLDLLPRGSGATPEEEPLDGFPSGTFAVAALETVALRDPRVRLALRLDVAAREELLDLLEDLDGEPVQTEVFRLLPLDVAPGVADRLDEPSELRLLGMRRELHDGPPDGLPVPRGLVLLSPPPRDRRPESTEDEKDRRCAPGVHLPDCTDGFVRADAGDSLPPPPRLELLLEEGERPEPAHGILSGRLEPFGGCL